MKTTGIIMIMVSIVLMVIGVIIQMKKASIPITSREAISVIVSWFLIGIFTGILLMAALTWEIDSQ